MPEISATVTVTSRDFATGAALGKLNAFFAAFAELSGGGEGGSGNQQVINGAAPLSAPLSLVGSVTVATLDIPPTVSESLDSVINVGDGVISGKLLVSNRSEFVQNVVFQSAKKIGYLDVAATQVGDSWILEQPIEPGRYVAIDLICWGDQCLFPVAWNDTFLAPLPASIITLPTADPTSSGTVISGLWSSPLTVNVTLPDGSGVGDTLYLSVNSTVDLGDVQYYQRTISTEDLINGSFDFVDVLLTQGYSFNFHSSLSSLTNPSGSLSAHYFVTVQGA